MLTLTITLQYLVKAYLICHKFSSKSSCTFLRYSANKWTTKQEALRRKNPRKKWRGWSNSYHWAALPAAVRRRGTLLHMWHVAWSCVVPVFELCKKWMNQSWCRLAAKACIRWWSRSLQWKGSLSREHVSETPCTLNKSSICACRCYRLQSIAHSNAYETGGDEGCLYHYCSNLFI